MHPLRPVFIEPITIFPKTTPATGIAGEIHVDPAVMLFGLTFPATLLPIPATEDYSAYASLSSPI